MNSFKADLDDWIENVPNIIIDLNIGIQNLERYYTNKYPNEANIKKTGFFQHHYFQLSFITIVQLAKLLQKSDNQKRNFKKLFENLRNEQEDEEIVKKTSELDLDTIESRVNEQKDLILKVIEARNKAFAHSDPKKSPEMPKLTELRILVDLCSDLYNEISCKFTGSTWNFKGVEEWDIDRILFHMNESKLRQKEILAKKKKDYGISD